MKFLCAILATSWCVAIAGCGGDEACGGARPAMTTCVNGAYWTNCGGTGEPRFACTSEDCRWFATACIAAEYRATDCPVGNPCCHAVEGGTWPYADNWPDYHHHMVEAIAVAGYSPVTESVPITLSVEIDPSVHVTDPSTVACGFPPSDHNYCRAARFRPAASGDQGLAISLLGDAFQPEVLTIEIVPIEGGFGARTFVTQLNDVDLPSRVACEAARSPRPQPMITGDITLSTADFSMPSAVHGSARLTVAEGPVTILF
jgi:hypothetical protein